MLLTKRIVQLIALKDTLLSFLKYANQGFSWYSYDGERFLLNCGVFFIFLYNCLTTAVGAQGKHDNLANDDKRLIHVFQGILETMAAAIQTLFIHQLSIKVCIIIGVLT